MLALPERATPEQISEWLAQIVTAASDAGEPVRLWEYYTGHKEPSLQILHEAAQFLGEGNVLEQPIQEGTRWQDLRSQILANLRGASPTPEHLRIFEEGLRTFSQRCDKIKV